MRVKDIVDKLNLEVIVDSDLEKEINGGYCGDLLSNVMARANEGDLWLTVQSHQNVIAVALLTEVAAVIVVENFEIDNKAIERAKEKGVNILRSDLGAYELAGLLNQFNFQKD
ncbi:MAG: DRTGG domain-containing protein [Bacillota bacterium]